MLKSIPFAPLPIRASNREPVAIPMIGRAAHAGFPSPADDFIEDVIDLNAQLIANPTATYLWRVAGDCMVDAKIFHGDVLVVDRSLQPKHRSIVLAVVDGDPTVKRLQRRGDQLFFVNENRTLPPFTVPEGTEISVWGVVTWTLRDLAN
jgi:DNA polymerase V